MALASLGGCLAVVKGTHEAELFATELEPHPDYRALRRLDMAREWPAMLHTANSSVGCYCADEARCQRSVLRELPAVHGAKISKA